jgi:hypothetical protein
MSAKNELIERLKYIDTAADLPVLIDIGIAPSEHNSVANLLRKGLSIVSFNILEDFIKNKAYESLDNISSSGISFSNLPNELQEYSISGALASLNFQSQILKKDNQDYKLTIQQETQKISSTFGSPFSLSKYSLLSSSSNVVAREVNDFLKAFGIPNGWHQLKNISDSIGGGIPDLAQAFNLAAQRRHSSAHSASFVYGSSWLSNIKSEVIAICASIDIVISARCRQAHRNPLISLISQALHTELNFRFLELHGTIYKETKTIGGNSRKNWSDLNDAIAHHQPLLAGRREYLIVLDSRRRITDWLT